MCLFHFVFFSRIKKILTDKNPPKDNAKNKFSFIPIVVG